MWNKTEGKEAMSVGGRAIHFQFLLASPSPKQDSKGSLEALKCYGRSSQPPSFPTASPWHWHSISLGFEPTLLPLPKRRAELPWTRLLLVFLAEAVPLCTGMQRRREINFFVTWPSCDKVLSSNENMKYSCFLTSGSCTCIITLWIQGREAEAWLKNNLAEDQLGFKSPIDFFWHAS